MKKKTVVLCELCADDRLATNVLHIGVCGEHDASIGALAGGGVTLNGNGRKRRKDLTAKEIAGIKALRRSGEAVKDIAAKFEVSPSTVTRYTKQGGK